MDKHSAECDRVPVDGSAALCYSTYQVRDCFTEVDRCTSWTVTTASGLDLIHASLQILHKIGYIYFMTPVKITVL